MTRAGRGLLLLGWAGLAVLARQGWNMLRLPPDLRDDRVRAWHTARLQRLPR